LLRISELSVYYKDLQALNDISLFVNEGEIVSVIGSNGAGKSTLLNAISGIFPGTSGRMEFLEERIDHLPSHKIVEKGIVQVPEGRKVFYPLTVLENLILGSYLPAAKKLREESLEKVFGLFPILRERRTQLAGTLSGGEQQMLAIGRGLMACPRLLILDEPSLGLSPLLVNEIFTITKEINQGGITVLLVEQNVVQALSLADRAYVLENGRIVLEGPGKELIDNPRVQEAYLAL
jgi:branched-chain amino acid transport system ATP-binding protein